MNKKRKTPEYDLQCKIADFLNIVLNKKLTFWSSIENSNHSGNLAGMVKQAKDKRKGVKAGLPDLVILYNNTSLWVELKAKAGVVSDKQKAVHGEIKTTGNNIEIIRNIEDLTAILHAYKIPTLIKG